VKKLKNRGDSGVKLGGLLRTGDRGQAVCKGKTDQRSTIPVPCNGKQVLFLTQAR